MVVECPVGPRLEFGDEGGVITRRELPSEGYEVE